MGVNPFKSSSSTRTCLPLTLEWAGLHELSGLVNSGAEECILDAGLADLEGHPFHQAHSPPSGQGTQQCKLTTVTRISVPLPIYVSKSHREIIQFYLIQSSLTAAVLGYFWLTKHNPHMEWRSHRVVNWSLFCHCFEFPKSSEIPNSSMFPKSSESPKSS